MKNQTARTLIVSMLSICSLLIISALGQENEKRVKMRDLPEPVRKTVQEQSKGATLRGLAKEVKDGQTFYEAELKVSGHTKDVLIDAAGAVVEIEEEVAMASLPPAVKATIEKNAGKGKITSVESITKNIALVAYEAHVSKAGKKSEIKVGADGKLISTENEQSEKGEKAEKSKTKKP